MNCLSLAQLFVSELAVVERVCIILGVGGGIWSMYKAMVVVVVGCVVFICLLVMYFYGRFLLMFCVVLLYFIFFFTFCVVLLTILIHSLRMHIIYIYREILRILIFWAKWGNSRASRFVSVVVDCDWLFSYFCIFVFDSWSLTSLGILMYIYIYIAAYSHNVYCGGCEFAVNIYVGFF